MGFVILLSSRCNSGAGRVRGSVRTSQNPATVTANAEATNECCDEFCEVPADYGLVGYDPDAYGGGGYD